jgi:hypothetical protein
LHHVEFDVRVPAARHYKNIVECAERVNIFDRRLVLAHCLGLWTLLAEIPSFQSAVWVS